jgi:hypothetical protein
MAAVTPAAPWVPGENTVGEFTMHSPIVEAIISELQDLVERLEHLPDISDAEMALMYLRHLRKRQGYLVPQPS